MSHAFEGLTAMEGWYKMKEMGDVSGIIAKFKSENYGIYAADARSKSGKLKMTKESFRGAMDGLMRHLQGRDIGSGNST